MMPGKYKDKTLTLTDMRELIGRTQTGKMTMEELMEAEKCALPGAGTCSMLGTANTMSSQREKSSYRKTVRQKDRGNDRGRSDTA